MAERKQQSRAATADQGISPPVEFSSLPDNVILEVFSQLAVSGEDLDYNELMTAFYLNKRLLFLAQTVASRSVCLTTVDRLLSFYRWIRDHPKMGASCRRVYLMGEEVVEAFANASIFLLGPAGSCASIQTLDLHDGFGRRPEWLWDALASATDLIRLSVWVGGDEWNTWLNQDIVRLPASLKAAKLGCDRMHPRLVLIATVQIWPAGLQSLALSNIAFNDHTSFLNLAGGLPSLRAITLHNVEGIDADVVRDFLLPHVRTLEFLDCRLYSTDPGDFPPGWLDGSLKTLQNLKILAIADVHHRGTVETLSSQALQSLPTGLRAIYIYKHTITNAVPYLAAVDCCESLRYATLYFIALDEQTKEIIAAFNRRRGLAKFADWHHDEALTPLHVLMPPI